MFYYALKLVHVVPHLQIRTRHCHLVTISVNNFISYHKQKIKLVFVASYALRLLSATRMIAPTAMRIPPVIGDQ